MPLFRRRRPGVFLPMEDREARRIGTLVEGKACSSCSGPLERVKDNQGVEHVICRDCSMEEGGCICPRP